jgi:transglutaminase-like putative cysteine protease
MNYFASFFPNSEMAKDRPNGKTTLQRTTMLGLLLVVLMVVAPHAGHLPVWITAICIGLLFWRGYLAVGGKPLPNRWLLLPVTLAGTGGVLFTYHTVFGREVGVSLLMFLSTLKLMELRNARDAMALIYLAFFIVITDFFYSQSVPTALYLLATLMVVMTTWVHLQSQRIAVRHCLSIAGVLMMQAIPLTLILFILFPRVQGPLWGLPQDAYSKSGLDNRMSPGSISRLSLSEDVAFRVSYVGMPSPRSQMYWRGPVLWYFDGGAWTPGIATSQAVPKFSSLSQPVDYVVTLEPHNKNWLFTLDVPDKLSVPSNLAADLQELSKQPVRSRMRYTARSYLGYQANVEESSLQTRRALQLPRQFDPMARKLATKWRSENISDASIVKAALAYFATQGFVYTLEPPMLGPDSVDDFLFKTKHGFCEHYASAFVFLMRAANVPARVVTGYLGGEYNEVGGYYIVRQSDAHAWAEVWLEGEGWVRVDPTAVIAPGRLETGLYAALSDSAALPFMERDPPKWMRSLRFDLDWITNEWNQWVLGYDTERQFAFLTRLGMEAVTWQKMVLDMMSGIGIVMALLALFMLRRTIRHKHDKVEAAWLRLSNKLAKEGLKRFAYEGALDYAARVASGRPQLAASILDLAHRYTALRYGARNNEGDGREFLRRAAAFKV